jgi:predicted small integral membrane protein
LSSAAPTASDTLSANNMAMFRFSTAASDTVWQACTADGTTQTCTSTAVPPVAYQAQVLSIDCREGTSCVFWIDGVAAYRARRTSRRRFAVWTARERKNARENSGICRGFELSFATLLRTAIAVGKVWMWSRRTRPGRGRRP